jgi:hypothetical protein
LELVFREEGEAIVVEWTECDGPRIAAAEGGEGFAAVLSRIAVSTRLAVKSSAIGGLRDL